MDAVERQITLPTPLDEAWELLTHPDELGRWLGDDVALTLVPGATGHVVDPDGQRRSLVIDEVEHGTRISWHWWPDDDPTAPPSRVEITLAPVDTGASVRVVEHLPTNAGPVAEASAAAAWSHRLLHLEALLLVAAAVRG
ncbi:MAG: SRPBCC domain-containing protein [Microthrixaceae bacterium]